MNIEHSNILITGAAGGIGSSTARQLGRAGARLLLTDLRAGPLDELVAELVAAGIDASGVAADVCHSEGRAELAHAAAEHGTSVVINIAGINPFGLFADQSDAEIERAMQINTIAPMLLCRALLPVLERRPEAHIVNVGSVFGSLGYPGFAVYASSKFAIRGFTESLRRELADTPIQLHYVAPRATRTALSTDRICAMNEELKVAMDNPETVAAAIESILRSPRREFYLGRPERIFGLLNALLPGLIDRALKKQLPIIRRYAAPQGGREARPPRTETVKLKIAGAER